MKKGLNFITKFKFNSVFIKTFIILLPIDSNTAKDEYDLLDVALKNATFKQGQFNNIMQNITPVILERLFLGLLNGKELSKESVDETLNSINNPFNSDSYYIGLSLNMVAEYVGINQSYLCRLFKENMNENFVDYISQYRIEKAELLLDSTNLTVKEVGYKVGFNSMPTFFRVFKKYNGLTPGQYRNKNN